jgi:hypothetical protein
VGSVEIPVLGLAQALHLAEEHAGLSQANYSLVDADFQPGTIVNDTLKSPATWSLGFARVQDGYWFFGSADDDGATNLVTLNAVSGLVLQSLSLPAAEPVLGNYSLTVSASQALATVRGLDLLNLPDGFTESANVTSITPRIVQLGVSSHTFYLYAPENGQYRLCWNVSLSYETSDLPEYQWQTAFYVDGQSGQVLAASAEEVFQPGPGAVVSASFVSSSAQNLTVSQQTFQMNTSLAGFPNPVAVDVPNVIVVRPGLTGAIPINFSYDGPAYVEANLDFSILPTDAKASPRSAFRPE